MKAGIWRVPSCLLSTGHSTGQKCSINTRQELVLEPNPDSGTGLLAPNLGLFPPKPLDLCPEQRPYTEGRGLY